MNPAAILSLISSLYEQLTAAHARIAELETALAGVASPRPTAVAGGTETMVTARDGSGR